MYQSREFCPSAPHYHTVLSLCLKLRHRMIYCLKIQAYLLSASGIRTGLLGLNPAGRGPLNVPDGATPEPPES